MSLAYRHFEPREHEVWRRVLEGHEQKRIQQVHPLFHRGLLALGLRPDRIPELAAVNDRLRRLTGFEGVPVEGLEENQPFFRMLAERRFPIGNFIRDAKDLSYTPAPDVIHDLYGHLPFLANRRYADFCADLGKLATRHEGNPDAEKQFSRFFWFTIEFGLIETPAGRRVFGAGIASSLAECDYALSPEPEVIPFDVGAIRRQEFRIDEFQRRLFLLRDEAQLYGSLEELERRLGEPL